MVLLDSLLITFLLLAIFLTIYHYTRNRRSDPPEPDANIKVTSTTSNLILVGSGISLGLAIFTKVPIITMIPLVAYLVYNNTKSFTHVCFWAIPVFLIPVLWPAYAILTGDYEGWKEGVCTKLTEANGILRELSIFYTKRIRFF